MGEGLCSSSAAVAVQSRGANGRVRKGWVIIRPPSRTLSFSVGEVWCAADAKRSADQYHGQLALISIEHVIDAVCACGGARVGVEKNRAHDVFSLPPTPSYAEAANGLVSSGSGPSGGQRQAQQAITYRLVGNDAYSQLDRRRLFSRRFQPFLFPASSFLWHIVSPVFLLFSLIHPISISQPTQPPSPRASRRASPRREPESTPRSTSTARTPSPSPASPSTPPAPLPRRTPSTSSPSSSTPSPPNRP